jgi:hypothetical protein
MNNRGHNSCTTEMAGTSQIRTLPGQSNALGQFQGNAVASQRVR